MGKEQETAEPRWVYRVDRDNVIRFLSPNMVTFALQNDWEASLPPEDVVGQDLLAFIEGIETRHLYEQLMRKVRQARDSVGPIPLRCDAPSVRRFLKVTLHWLPDDGIEFESELVRTEPRPEVRSIRSGVARSEQIIVMCSMCKKMKLPDGSWLEIEDGLVRLGIFEKEQCPRISHGLCPRCLKEIRAKMFETDAGGEANR